MKLPRELVARLHPDRKERDRHIKMALEEYLAVPILDVPVSRAPKRARKHFKKDARSE